MSTRSEVEHDGTSASVSDEGQIGPSTGDRSDPPFWSFGSRIAAHNVEVARMAYLRYAEWSESTLNAIETTATVAGQHLRAAASETRGALVLLRAKGEASAQDKSVAVRRGFDALKAKTARGRADLRDIALQGQVAADTNVRAYLDCLGDLAKAPSLKKFVALQSSFFWDQSQRSLQQAFDLQRRTFGALRKITSAPTA